MNDLDDPWDDDAVEGEEWGAEDWEDEFDYDEFDYDEYVRANHGGTGPLESASWNTSVRPLWRYTTLAILGAVVLGILTSIWQAIGGD
ncbi:hypothetical protein [Crateriforma conspicua]|uniref:hypothetical protein n=1 Tax=Crateriforma conspicua TaxID=2527996 RepID=UPI00118B4053|nr:hypothetical protein [Crateriforma conspicua]QDV62165.1 hypothetical protein Mal65_12980 [Crateriforma conspicua]